MDGRGAPKRNFAEVLEKGAQIDEIFKASEPPLGTDPFEAGAFNEGPDGGDPGVQASPALSESEIAAVTFIDNDSLFCVSRKLAAVEGLFRLVTRDYLPFGQLVSEILRVAMEQIRSEGGSFLEIDHRNKCLFFRATTGRSSEKLLDFTVPEGQGVAGFVCETQQPMVLSSVDDSQVYLRSISDAVGFEAKNLIAHPVVIRGVTFGCIELLNRLGEPRYTDADREVMAVVAEWSAKVIEQRLIAAAMSKVLVAA